MTDAKSPFDGTAGTSSAAGGTWGNSGGSTAASSGERESLLRLQVLVREWLDDTDRADADDPTIDDFYARVGARWGKGNYYRRFREALDGR